MMAAAPDVVLAAIFLITWIAPDTFGRDAAMGLIYVLIFEFIILHSAAVLVAILLGNFSRTTGLVLLLGLSLFYGVFGVAFAHITGALWPVLTMVLLTINRMMTLRRQDGATGAARITIIATWVMTCGFYFLAMILGGLLPWPSLGLDDAVIARLTTEASGSLVEEPQTSMAAGVLYFLGLGLADWFGVFARVSTRLQDRFGAFDLDTQVSPALLGHRPPTDDPEP